MAHNSYEFRRRCALDAFGADLPRCDEPALEIEQNYGSPEDSVTDIALEGLTTRTLSTSKRSEST